MPGVVRKLAGEGTEERTGVAREDKSGIVLLDPSKSWEKFISLHVCTSSLISSS